MATILALTTQLTDVSGTVADSLGNLLLNAPLIFYWKLTTDTTYQLIGTATTDPVTGVATISSVALPSPDALDIQAVFSGEAIGSTIYDPSSAVIVYDTTSTLLATQLTETVKAALSTDGRSAVAMVNGTLTGGTNGTTPIVGATISISVDSGAETGTATTDANGNYTASITRIPLGSHTVTVSYAGDTVNASSGASATFTVEKVSGFSGAGVGIAAIAVVALLGGFAFVSRGRKRRRR